MNPLWSPNCSQTTARLAAISMPNGIINRWTVDPSLEFTLEFFHPSRSSPNPVIGRLGRMGGRSEVERPFERVVSSFLDVVGAIGLVKNSC